MLPRAETAHWLFAAGFLFFGLVVLAEAIVGADVFRRRRWRAYLWPSLALFAGAWLWLIAIFSTFSTLHLLAHSVWAQAATAAGAVQLAVVRGRLHSSYWSLVTAGALFVSGASFLVHEQNGWLFARSAFLHHLIGWTLVVSALFPVGAAFLPRRAIWAYGFAITWIAVAVMLFADRDIAPIFGHLSDLAGGRGKAALAALVVPAAAAAHATLKEATPGEQSRLDAAPTEITLRYDQAVTATPGSIVVLAPDGHRVSGRVTQSDGHTVIRAPLHGLVAGQAYTVRWHEISADGHVGNGVFTFGVGVDAPPPTEAVGASGTTWRDDVARWALFVSLALVIGVVGVRLLILPGPLDPRVERRIHLLGTFGAVAAVNAGIIGFVIRCANALQVSGVDLLYSDLSPFAESTRFGIAFLLTTLGYGLCITILAVAWVLDRPALRWPAFLLAIVLAWGYSLSSHQATEPNASLLGEVADWVHLVAAMLWVGGVLTLAVVVWPLAPDLRRAAFLRFSRIAIGLVGVLVLAGTFVAIQRLPQLDDLWDTSYGRTLLVKIGLVLVALSWGGMHHMVVRPRLERGDRVRGVGGSLLVESTVAIAVLLAAAVLVNGAPPPVDVPVQGAAPTAGP